MNGAIASLLIKIFNGVRNKSQVPFVVLLELKQRRFVQGKIQRWKITLNTVINGLIIKPPQIALEPNKLNFLTHQNPYLAAFG